MNQRERLLYALILLLAGAVLCYGWKLYWFLTDDAYISFRYVSNWALGHGPVWNPPPFRPVEGYTNFLWIVLLYGVWQVLDVAPPAAANYLALCFALCSLYITAQMLLRLPWSSGLRPYRWAFLALLLLAVTTNRTFLAWSSSGLETALFGCTVLAWTWACAFVDPSHRRWPLAISAAAAGIYLTRPDGLLFLGVTAVALSWAWRTGCYPVRRLAQAWPLLAAPLHLVWRQSLYGEWLPNTYYAKAIGAWSASGFRYALSFALEYALWTWGLLLVYVLWKKKGALRPSWHGLLVALALCGHAAYYTFVHGGDHFEYRIYAHLVPLCYLSFAWCLNAVGVQPKKALVVLGLAVVLSWPIPWIHWSQTHHIASRGQTLQLKVPVAPHFPAPIRWYAAAFDELQFWLIDRFVCIRHQEHKANAEFLAGMFPPRAQGQFLPAADYPVFFFPAIGIPAWRLPHINILDVHGLNDYVIARTPPEPTAERMMAHERTPPAGYVECFQPNVRLVAPGQVKVFHRVLSADHIADCETRWAASLMAR